MSLTITTEIDALVDEVRRPVFRCLAAGDIYGAWRFLQHYADDAGKAWTADHRASFDSPTTQPLRIVEAQAS